MQENTTNKLKIGFVAGSFDLLHAGHVLMLKEARSVCDRLVVGIQVDPTIDRPEKNKPIQSFYERVTQLQGCKYVDAIFPYVTEQDLEDFLTTADIQIRIIGEDHKDTWKTGKEICEKRGIEIYYNKRDHRFSSTELRERIKKC